MRAQKTVERECANCNKQFLASAKEVNRGNGIYCSLSCVTTATNKTRPTREVNCRRCGKEFITARTNTLYCSDRCKNFKAVSKQTKNKCILKELPCALCGWDLAARDVHHIVPIKDGGGDELTNLITLCPNHHRLVHTNLISQEQLLQAVNTRTISSSEVLTSELDANVVIKET